MKDALLLVFANKQDIKGALKPAEVQEKLNLNQVKDRTWYVAPSCATSGDGLYEGLVSKPITSAILGKGNASANGIYLGLAFKQRENTPITKSGMIYCPLHATYPNTLQSVIQSTFTFFSWLHVLDTQPSALP